MQVVVNVLGRGEPVDEAIAAPRLHVDDDDGRVHLEGGHAARDTDDLAAAGWNVVRWAGRNLFFGGVSAVELRADGSFDAAATLVVVAAA